MQHTKRRRHPWRVALATCLFFVVGTLVAQPSAAATYACESHGYACTTGGYTGANPWGYPPGHNCTSYAAFKAAQGGSRRPGRNLGNARSWAANARADGFVVNSKATVGAIAQWTSHGYYSPYGHVAYVEKVTKKTITVTEDNAGPYNVTRRYKIKRGAKGFPAWPDNFIHFPRKAPTAATTSSSSSVAAGKNADGRIEVAAVGANGAVYTKYQTAPNSSFISSWHNKGGNVRPSVAMQTNEAGQMHIFTVGKNGHVYAKWQVSPGGSWTSSWTSMGGNMAK